MYMTAHACEVVRFLAMRQYVKQTEEVTTVSFFTSFLTKRGLPQEHAPPKKGENSTSGMERKRAGWGAATTHKGVMGAGSVDR